MKKTLSVILAVITIALCLCSCSKAELLYAEYIGEYTPESYPCVSIYDDEKAGFTYHNTEEGTQKATYIYDRKSNTLTLNLRKSETTLVFIVEEDKLIFVADKSSGVKEIDGIPLLTDGQELIV